MTNAFLKLPIPFEKIYVYPPSVKDIIELGSQVGTYMNIFTISQEEIEDLLVSKKVDLSDKAAPTPLEYLLMNAYQDKVLEGLIKKIFEFYTHQEINFLYEKKEIWVGNLEQIAANAKTIEDLNNIQKLDEKNYFNFQNVVRQSLGLKTIEMPDPNEHPKIKAMKAKQRLRDRVKAKQNAKNGITLETNLIAICCMGLGLNPLNIGEISYSALGSLTKMYQTKEKYQLDVDSLMAGADSKKIKPKYWIRNLD